MKSNTTDSLGPLWPYNERPGFYERPMTAKEQWDAAHPKKTVPRASQMKSTGRQKGL